jgi:membrane-bound lytic murein transglycosylase A
VREVPSESALSKTAVDAPPIGEDEIGALASPPGFANLPGWAVEDHLAALHAFIASCPAQKRPAFVQVCARAEALSQPDDLSARRFFEDNFKPEPSPASGLLTGYFTPVYDARAQSEGDFTAPVRPRPADLSTHAASAAYADRNVIERRPATDAIAWMRPEDLFFLQIQGSGVLVFPGGARWRAVFDGANGAPFLGIAAPLRQRGLLLDNDTSAQSIHDWLVRNRGPLAESVMDLDKRYVFFRLEPDDGQTPAGAAGVRLVPGRDLAVDPTKHILGDIFWVDAQAPSLTGAFPTYRRLAVALDTGSAIKGEVRADLYFGEGADAGLEAGRVKHELRLYRLDPIGHSDP